MPASTIVHFVDPSIVAQVEALPVMGFDTETHLMGLGNLAPGLVCLTMAVRAGLAPDAIVPQIALRNDPGAMNQAIDLLTSGQYRTVGHNVAYDSAVLCATFPHLFPVIFEMYANGLILDTKVREKLLNLATTGDLENMVTPDGQKSRIKYSLSDLVKFYFGVDISESKSVNDAWRTNYAVLDDTPLDRWPEEAKTYAMSDSAWTLRLFEVQERRRADLANRIGRDPLAVQIHRCCVDFALKLISCRGVALDHVEVRKLEAMVKEELAPQNHNLLIEHGILVPGEPPRPNALGHKDHVEGCRKKWVEAGRTIECSCPVKMTNAIEEKESRTKLHAYVEQFAARTPSVVLRRTDPSAKFPQGQLSVDAEFLQDYAHLDPVLQQYKRRQDIMKVVTTEIPRMMMRDKEGNSIPGEIAPFVHPGFDCLKETGRTSSMSEKGWPSFNCQNVDPRARGCYVPRPGFVLFSVDYNAMELISLAQTCYTRFGHSVLRDKINAGVDPHAFLGAQIAYETDATFRQYVQSTNAGSRDDIYEIFHMLAESADEGTRKFYKHFRTLAKPTGLGYPGGLGAKTFVDYAKATFELSIDLDTAKKLREIWHSTYPEMQMYFDWLTTQAIDPQCPKVTIIDKVTREEKAVDAFAYTTPMGMYRARAMYCAAANGNALQSPSAEAATTATWNVVRACYDPSLRSILCDDDKGVTTRVLAFIHDELFGEVRDDEMAPDRVRVIQDLMEESMRLITPDVTVRTAACLMRRWDKKAEPVFDSNGRLTVWEPKPKK